MSKGSDIPNTAFDYRSFYHERDERLWEELTTLVQEYQLPLETILQHFMAFVRRRDFVQTVAYTDLFRLVLDKPGSIVEAGVFMGNGLFTWSKLMETFCPGDRGRKIFGFDNFRGYASSNDSVDAAGVAHIKNLVGDFKVDQHFVERLVRLHNMDNLIAGEERVKLYSGELSETVDQFFDQEPGVRISLLLCDVNLQEPTSAILNRFFESIIPGGIIALRGYGVKPWEGESKAVDAFLAEKGIRSINKFAYSPYPAVYFTKP